MKLSPGFIETGSIRDHATKDHAEVCPVSREVMFQPLSEPLQPGIRFLCDPIPAPPTARLAVRLPRGQQYGLTTFPICHTTGLGPAYSPVVLRRRIPIIDRDNRPHTFWLLPNSSFGNLIITTFISSSLVLPMPASLAPRPGTAPSVYALPHGRNAPHQGATLSGKLQTPPLPVTRVSLGYRWSHNESATIPYRQ